MSTVDSPGDLTYPRQEALTRRFRLGAPRAFTITPGGQSTMFIRSMSGRDAVGCLWRARIDGSEQLLVDTHALISDDADLPAAERARRERAREVTSGITAYSTDDECRRAAFSVDGTLYCALIGDEGAEVRAVPAPGAVVDPRMSPDGALIAYVHDGALYVSSSDGTGAPRLLAAPETTDQTWGLADFVAAEELERHRGLWWLPDSSAVLAELVDESDVQLQWIADPAVPSAAPREHRYPAAGTPNPTARLFRCAVDGTRQEIEWDRDEFPYLATVDCRHRSGSVVSVLSRDQTHQLILHVPHGSDSTSTLATRTTTPWITMQGGVPSLSDEGQLLEIVADSASDTFRLTRDGQAVSPEGVQVSALIASSGDGYVVLAHQAPSEQHVLRIDNDGSLTWLTTGPTVDAAVCDHDSMVIVRSGDDYAGSRITLQHGDTRAQITNRAEQPVVTPHVRFHAAGAIDFAVILPADHVAGTRLPVVMAPYGGPHHNRVVHAANAFASDQWLADQGFAVVVVDGRGTPGRGPAREFAVSGDLASGVLQDQVDGLHAAAGIYPDLDLARVGITGWSFGGYLAALAVLDRPDVFHCAVAGAPVTEWRLYDTAYTERYLGDPNTSGTVYDSCSLLPRAPHLERPLLLIHGLADDNVVVAHTLQLSSALLAAGRPHTVLPLSGVTHMTPQEVVAENLLRLEVDFLHRHLQS